MSLRVKTALICSSLFLILFAALHLAASSTLIGSFSILAAGGAGAASSIRTQEMADLHLLDISLALIGLSLLALSFLTADVLVLKRLRRLRSVMQRIDAHGDLSERIEVTGSDELSQFAREVNILLENLQHFRRRNDALLSAIPDNMIVIDQDGVLVDHHITRREHLIADPDESLGRRVQDILPREVGDMLLDAMAKAAETGTAQCMEYELPSPQGEVRQYEARVVMMSDEQFLAMIRDVTERKRVEASLKMQISALNAAGDQVIIMDSAGKIEFVNPAFEKTTGYTYDEMVGQDWGELSEDGFRKLEDEVKSLLLKGESWHGEINARRKDGSLSTEEITITPILEESGTIAHYIAIKRDITEKKQCEARLDQMAHHDVLTGLPNRLLFSDRLTQRLTDARRTGEQVAVMFLDLDRFKLVNDTLGHNAGDELLKQVADRLQRVLREADTVARMGGDEFTIILSHIHNVDEATLPARRILEVLSKPFDICGHELYVTTSIGVSMYPSDGSDVESLVRAADTAMYHAKENGRNTYRFYTEQLNIAATERMRLENYLRKAIEHNELLAYYQPRVCMHTSRLLGTEALVRWMHPELKLMPPAQFIPLSEETGLIVPIGEWMLKTACLQNKAWQDTGLPRIDIGINVSARQFQIADLVSTVKRTLDETGLSPQYLALEITESTLITHPDHAVKVLKKLKNMGVRIYIDDFGTGYSSLSHLKHFPIDAVKIDKSFVRNITTDPDDAAIASAIVAMAHNLKLKVVAEGVETIEQLDFLRKLDCDEMQGYFVGTPVPAEDLQHILENAALIQPVHPRG